MSKMFNKNKEEEMTIDKEIKVIGKINLSTDQ
jgi:hypothetical protein